MWTWFRFCADGRRGVVDTGRALGSAPMLGAEASVKRHDHNIKAQPSAGCYNIDYIDRSSFHGSALGALRRQAHSPSDRLCLSEPFIYAVNTQQSTEGGEEGHQRRNVGLTGTASD